MTSRTSALFEAFRADHAILGRGFYEVSALLRAGDVPEARRRAERLDREAGAHMAFEERHFYPALRSLIGDEEVDRLYGEHEQGLAVVKALAQGPADRLLAQGEVALLLKDSELMESHVAECGELFGTMGRIPPGEQEELYRRLFALRRASPRWTDLSSAGGAGGASP